MIFDKTQLPVSHEVQLAEDNDRAKNESRRDDELADDQ